MSRGNRAPEGFVYVRSHLRRKPTGRARGRRLSGWTIAALVAGVWLWGQVVGFGGSGDEGPASSETSVSESANR